ncbi:MAG: phosphodiester glycosidase family protein, partial [Candidatus Promineifilaceae bacterium]
VLVTVEESYSLPLPTTEQIFPAEVAAEVGDTVPDTGWQELRQGLERRVINLSSEDNQSTHSVYILRIDPAHFSFEVGYHPAEGQSLLKWIEDSGALIAVNGGYFTEEEYATGLVIANGTIYGTSFEGYGGMIAVDSSGPSIRWLKQQPYDESEMLTSAIQSFPMLITPGGKLTFKEPGGDKARRTVAATDASGMFLLIVFPSATFTLDELGSWLEQSDLEIDRALNLDGGASTGLILSEPGEGIPSFSALPSVLLVYPK